MNANMKNMTNTFSLLRMVAWLMLVSVINIQSVWADDYYLRGVDGNWDAVEANKMNAGTNSIVWMPHATNSGYTGFKITKGTTYDTQYGQNSGNVSLGAPYQMNSSPSQNAYTDNWSEGTYYYYFNTSTYYLVVYDTIEVKGDVMSGGWNSTTSMTYQNDGSFKQVTTVSLTGGSSYAFKIHANGTYTGYSASVSCTNGTVADDGTNNHNINLTPNNTGQAIIVFHPEAGGTINVYCPYKVSYNKGTNGTGTNTNVVEAYGTSVTLAGVLFSRSGYQQDGWSTSDGGAKVYELNGSYTANVDVTLYPHWVESAEETHDVTISYKYGDTSIRVNATESAVGISTSRSVTAPDITGYTFASWTLGSGITNQSANTTTNPITIVTKTSGTYTLQANYTLNSHNVIFNANGGSGSMSNESFNYNETKALMTNTFTRTGYVFKGWATSAANALAGTVAYDDGDDFTMADADVTLYAVWYQKVYYVNSNNWTAANIMAHVFVDATSWQTWNTQQQVMTSTGTTAFGFDIYTYEFPTKYTSIIFHNAGSNQTSDLTAQTGQYYCGAWYASLTALREGWKVYGSWDDWSGNDFASYGESTATYTVSLAAATTYSFKYVFAGTSTWYGGGGGTMSDGDTWTLDGSEDVSFTTSVAGPYTFTINYSAVNANNGPSCTLTYPTAYTLNYSFGAVNGSAGSIACDYANASQVLAGTEVTLTAPAPISGNYTWKGWYTNAEGTEGKIDDDGRAITITMDENKTLYACYTEIMHTVTVAAGEHGSVSPASVSAGVATASASITASSNNGYYLSGWTRSSESDITFASGSATASPITIRATADAQTITANFAPRTITITLNNQGANTAGTGSVTTTFGTNTNITTITPPLKTGCTFQGYYTAQTDGAQVISADGAFIAGVTGYTDASKNWIKSNTIANVTQSTDEVILYAHWFEPKNTVALSVSANDDEDDGTVVAYYATEVPEYSSTPIANPANIQLGMYTPVKIVATPTDNTYRLQQWRVTSGTIYFCDENGVRDPSGYTKTTTYIIAAQNSSIEAVFEPNFITGWYLKAGNDGRDMTSTDALDKSSYARAWTRDEFRRTAAGATTATCVLTVTSADITGGKNIFEFVVENANTSAYYYGADWNAVKWYSDAGPYTMVGSGKNMRFFADVPGDYVFTLDFTNATTPTISLAWPTTGNYVRGGFNEWAFDKVLKETATTGVYSVTFPIHGKVGDGTRNYEFKVVIDGKQYGKYSTTITNANTSTSLALNESNMNFTVEGAGNYTFIVDTRNATKTLTVTYPSGSIYAVNFGVQTASVGKGTMAATMSGIELTTGEKVYNTETITFEATNNPGYRFTAWYNAATGTTASWTENNTAVKVLQGFTGSVNAYAAFVANTYTVTIADEGTGGTATHTNDAGPEVTTTITHGTLAEHTFSKWEISGNYEFVDATTATSATIKLHAFSNLTVTAVYEQNPRIYFKKPSSWGENVYVYFYKNSNYWDNAKGTGSGTSDYSSALASGPHTMTQVGETDIYYFAYDSYYANVVFADKSVNEVYFSNCHVARRGDFNAATPLFVPDYETITELNPGYTAQYSSNGYWRTYNSTATNYVLRGYDSEVFGGWTGKAFDFTFTSAESNEATCSVIFHAGNGNATYLSTAKDYWLAIYNHSTQYHYADNYSDGTITYTMRDDGVEIGPKCTYEGHFAIRSIVEGIYTLHLLFNDNGKLTLTVDYPIVNGDFDVANNSTGMPSCAVDGADGEKTLSFYMQSGLNNFAIKQYEATDAGLQLGDANIVAVSAPSAGVYTIPATVDAGSISLGATPDAYTGNYYIRTDAAPGGWVYYTRNNMIRNATNSYVVGDNSTFDHYYCRWYSGASDNNGAGPDDINNYSVAFVVANDYNPAISDTVFGDDVIGESETHLPLHTNVRFSYNSSTNTVKRTYLLGSQENDARYLNILSQNVAKVFRIIDANEVDMFDASDANRKFIDNGNWEYELPLNVIPGATAGITADYNGETQTFLPASTLLMGGTSSKKYPVILKYDFKTNHLFAAWRPAGEVTENIDLQADMMIIRTGQEDPDQITFTNDNEIVNARIVYATLQFNYDDMVNQMPTWNQTAYQFLMYYISFPFDVRIADIYGCGSYGEHWILQKYNGEKRAQTGWFRETDTFWETMSQSDTLHAHIGYGLILDRVTFNDPNSVIWNNKQAHSANYLYFPSAHPVGTISTSTQVITIPEHLCGIDQEFLQDEGLPNPRNHKWTDSNWNLVGTPLFQSLQPGVVEAASDVEGHTLDYLYTWNYRDNSLSIRHLTTDFTFPAMQAYLVQYAGDVTFVGASIPSAVAARQAVDTRQLAAEIELTQADMFVARTYVELRENAQDNFQLNEDVYMMNSSRTADIYTFAGAYDLAANVLSINNHTVPVGINVHKDGEYTFSMPSTFDGIIILVDNETGARTNLLLDTYTVNLTRGRVNERFYLEIGVDNVVTNLENIDANANTLNDGKAHKFIRDGRMYILRDGKVYTITGKRAN